MHTVFTPTTVFVVLKLVYLCEMCLYLLWLVLTSFPLLFCLIKVISLKWAVWWHLLCLSHCDILSNTLWTQCWAPWPFSCSAFSHKSVSLLHLSPSLTIFLLSKSNSLSPQSLYHWACILTNATSTTNDALCLHIAGHLTWLSTISGDLSKHVSYLTTKQQGSLAQHKIQTQQQGISGHAIHAGGTMQHARKEIKNPFLLLYSQLVNSNKLILL